MLKYSEVEAKLHELKYRFQDWLSIKRGYIDSEHEPLKCTCGCIELEDCNHDYLDTEFRSTVLEYDCRCKQCGKILGHWAYGYWQR